MTFRLLLLLTLLFSVNLVYGQDQKEADSLITLLDRGIKFPDSVENEILYDIVSFTSSPDNKLKYANLLITNSYNNFYVIKAYQLKGVAYRLKGDIRLSLENLFRSASIASENKMYEFEAEGYLEVASTYTSNNDLGNALHYEQKGVDIIRKIEGRGRRLGISLLNIGLSYLNLNKIDSALFLYNEAESIFNELNHTIGKAYTIGNRALAYKKQGKLVIAEKDLLAAIKLLEPLGDQFGMSDYHNHLGNLYFEQGRYEQSINHTKKALIMSRELGLKEQIRDAVLLLSKLYTAERDYENALKYQGQFLSYKDSIENSEQTKKIADIRTEFEVSLREKEINLLEKNEALNKIYIIGAIILLILSLVVLLYFRQRFLNTRLIASEEKRQHNDKIQDLLKKQETKALQSMVTGRENERKRLAKDLHNHFGSLLATIKVNINGIEENAIPNYDTLSILVDQACSDMRNISHSLNMGISENFGLVAALKELTDHLKHADDLKVEFEASMCDGLMDSENEILIYRIVQELISNVLKHADASKLSVLLTCFEEEEHVNILVQDDGKGFDIENVKDKPEGIGLNSLEQLVEECKGEITFDSNHVSGTTVSIDFPISLETKLN